MPKTDKNKVILIVEDEPPVCRILKDRFGKEGFGVLVAMNGKEGLELANANHPDVILLDLLMPTMDGMTMMKTLRRETAWGKTVPIVILTNLSADDAIIKGVIRDQPSFYMLKTDWRIDDVVRKVRVALGEIED